MNYGAGTQKSEPLAAAGYGTELTSRRNIKRGRIFENLRSGSAFKGCAKNRQEQDGVGDFSQGCALFQPARTWATVQMVGGGSVVGAKPGHDTRER